MKFVTAVREEERFIGVVKNEAVINVSALAASDGKKVARTLLEGIQQGEAFTSAVHHLMNTANASEYTYQLEEVQLLAPIPRPSKNVFCIGKNYRDHAIEMGSEADVPENIMVFSKAPTAIIGHEEGIPSHSNITNQLDYEGELAVVIGKTGTGINEAEAMDHVFGYTIINDITARDLQQKHKQFLLGKSLNGTCPMGPWIVHHSEISNPENLMIETKVNGEVRQKGNTSDFIFDIRTMITELSKGMTLEAGDIIATGTLAGVGKGMKPPVFLKAGDTIEITVEGIGTLRNEIVE
ncbi:fumarylacetoacetate hydrolase family protein [Fictibacillus phosphorivorans]|uniref:fumarylacetoacetate hydrolase family protein n=1 Tax=Fictibacillus phosphorivorans TaxID=1221500 RepID=UPI00203BBA8D|nr:fumarylacetoacetate hydrolase family protein [Fictibacillus phosphorivorans]MCM3718671.1 fumarylacetoacetate hydrolase family protein [Fictibacillus phosphorivorans]MCM3776294.1 fumarylacetoacetate hydrolase family protein [Fictibacillus phosphorivorans]